MADFSKSPVAISLQAFRIEDEGKRRFINADDGIEKLKRAYEAAKGKLLIASYISERQLTDPKKLKLPDAPFLFAEWLDQNWPREFNSVVYLCREGAVILPESVDPEVTQTGGVESWANRPLPDSPQIEISNGWNGFFYTLTDALAYLREETGRVLGFKIGASAIPAFFLKNTGHERHFELHFIN